MKLTPSILSASAGRCALAAIHAANKVPKRRSNADKSMRHQGVYFERCLLGASVGGSAEYMVWEKSSSTVDIRRRLAAQAEQMRWRFGEGLTGEGTRLFDQINDHVLGNMYPDFVGRFTTDSGTVERCVVDVKLTRDIHKIWGQDELEGSVKMLQVPMYCLLLDMQEDDCREYIAARLQNLRFSEPDREPTSGFFFVVESSNSDEVWDEEANGGYGGVSGYAPAMYKIIPVQSTWESHVALCRGLVSLGDRFDMIAEVVSKRKPGDDCSDLFRYNEYTCLGNSSAPGKCPYLGSCVAGKRYSHHTADVISVSDLLNQISI